MIIYKLARTKDDLDDVYRLQFRVRCLEQQEPEDGYPARREIDMFDRHAFHAVARHFDLAVVATARVVTLSPLGLPMEQGKRLKGLHLANAAELSKISISRFGLIHSGTSPEVILQGLLKVLHEESRRRGIQSWYVLADSSTLGLLSSCGITPIPLEHVTAGTLLHLIDLRHGNNKLFGSGKVRVARDLRQCRNGTLPQRSTCGIFP